MNIVIKKMINFMQEHYNIFMYVSFFVIFFYPFNISLKDYVYKNDFILFILMVISLLIIFIEHFYEIKKSIRYISSTAIATLFVLGMIIIVRNGDIFNLHFGMPFFTIYSIILVCILASSKKWYKIALNVMLMFVMEHVIATIISFLFPQFYLNAIMPLFSDFNKELMYQFEHNQIAGLTQHYSTNAAYLLIGAIIEVFYLKIDCRQNRKKSLFNIFFMIITLLALLLTGKRTQIFGGLLSIIVIYGIINRGSLKKQAKKILLGSIITVTFIGILSIFIPEISGPITRTIESIEKKDLLASRRPMYELAIENYKQNKLFGSGWGTYKYLYNTSMALKERDYMDAHNIYLQMLCEIGIVGTGIILGLILYAMYRGITIKASDEDEKYISIYLTYQLYILIEGFVGNAFYDVQVLIPYMIFTALLISCINIQNRGKEEILKMEKSVKNKILSVSVAAYNIENMIRQNIESFINSEVRDDIEVIVTDDGSKDKTADIIKEYADKYPDTIKLIKQKNQGPGSTVNSGISNATGKYFKMVDGDDWVETDNLKRLIEELKKTDADMILTNYEIYDNKQEKIIETVKVKIPENEIFKMEDIGSKLNIQMHNVTYKTQILKDYNIRLDKGFYTDMEYLLLPMLYVNTVKYIDINIYVYRIAQSQQSVSIPSMQKNIAMHKQVLDRLVEFYVQNIDNLKYGTKKYVCKAIANMADVQLGTLLTFEQSDENKKKIVDFNKQLREKSKDIYNIYKKSKKCKVLLYSRYMLYNQLSKKYIEKLNRK